jgi:hypothetical protein
MTDCSWLTGTGTHFDRYREYWNAATNLNATGSMYMYVPDPNGAIPNNQQILVGEYDGGFGNSNVVPEPFTLAFGLAAAGAYVRRRARAKRLTV